MDASTTRPRRRRRGGRRRPTTPLHVAARLARARFGVQRLRSEQEKAFLALAQDRDVLAVLPTGYGKSLLYQVEALRRARPTVVVSPLLALITDQVQILERRGVPCARLDSSVRAAERRAALERIRAGGSLVVMTTPETLQAADVQAALREGKPALFVVDEAHCISEWGHDFRPAYLRLHDARAALGGPVALALTATATARVRDDVIARLALRAPTLVVAPPARENLELEARLTPGAQKLEVGGRLLASLERPGIVYCATTVEVDRVWRALARSGIPALRYHGRMTKAERAAAQQRFMPRGRRLVMVATSAFGMGIDKPDVRFVLHWQAPGSLEQYVQEAGRGGRDGKPCRCTLLFDPADLEVQRRLIRQSSPRAAQLRRVAGALLAWHGEGRAVSSAELAISAAVPRTIARVLLDELEELGLLVEPSSAHFQISVAEETFGSAVDDLVPRLEVHRLADERRVEAVREYAEAGECRAAFLGRFFGEEAPSRCGRCDVCRGGALPAEEAKRRRRRSRGRRRRRRAG